jgi:hypothetical protein
MASSSIPRMWWRMQMRSRWWHIPNSWWLPIYMLWCRPHGRQ